LPRSSRCEGNDTFFVWYYFCVNLLILAFMKVRPLSTKELIKDEAKACVRVSPSSNANELVVGEDKRYTFDHVIGPDQGQGAVYDSCVKGLVDDCLAGYNSCILAYGQTVGGPRSCTASFSVINSNICI